MESVQSINATHPEKKEKLVRFGILTRVEHFTLMVTFIMLSITGLAEKFYQTSAGSWLIAHLGGIVQTRQLHHIFAYIFIAGAAYHFCFLIFHLKIRKGPASMMPTIKDAKDSVNYLRYCIGLTEQHPEFGRFDYRQKFEYWGIIFGGLIMLFSGAVLMWPIIITKLLPGAVVPAAKEFHSNEALLALLTIIVWHFYSAHFRPGTFPGDFSIFTGRISKERMIEEHSLEYQQIAGKKDLAPQNPGDKEEKTDRPS